jgi:MFS family permease
MIAAAKILSKEKQKEKESKKIGSGSGCEGAGAAQAATSLLSLDLFSLFLAPVRGGAGPYLAFYFASQRHWSAGKIGMLLGTMALAFAFSQIPAGLIIDRVGRQRELAAGALAIIAISLLAMLLTPASTLALPIALLAQAAIGVACAFFTPAVASLSLGLVGYDSLNRRLGRNEVFCHIGNILTGILLGFGMQKLGGDLILTLLIAACAAGVLFALLIADQSNHHAKSECLQNSESNSPTKSALYIDANVPEKKLTQLLSGFHSLATVKGAGPFALSAMMFFFANAAMLPLMIQLISRHGHDAAVRLPAALLLAELVMIPVCALAGRKADMGRKPLLLLSFFLLAARGICFSLIQDANVLVAVQILDGISAGIFSLLLTIVVADLTRARGNLNSMLCALMMILTTTNAISDFICGSMATTFGFAVAFGLMAAIALSGALIFCLFVPETAPSR